MDKITVMTKPLTKEETKALLGFIEKSNIIYNKTTNASTNKLKTEEWRRITDEFNATATSCRRTPQRLRLRWENLKKNCRKRNTTIRMNNIKTGGGAPDYIPPDDILDRVASLLGSTVDGFSVRFGGDAEPEICVVGDSIGGGGSYEISLGTEVSPDKLEVQKVVEDSGICYMVTTPKPKSLETPRASGFKRKKLDENRASRNKALAEYYDVKKKVLEANLEKVLLENEKLKLEIENLKNNK